MPVLPHPSVTTKSPGLDAARDAALNYARRLVGQSDCEDVAQETILRVLPLWQADPGRCTMSYVLSVTHNIAMNLLTSGYRIRHRESPPGHEPSPARQASPPDVVDAAANLQPTAYQALVLTEVKGLSDCQVARAMNVSRSLVGAKRREAIDILRTLSLHSDDEPRDAVA